MTERIVLVSCNYCDYKTQVFVNKGRIITIKNICAKCNRAYKITKQNIIKEIPLLK